MRGDSSSHSSTRVARAGATSVGANGRPKWSPRVKRPFVNKDVPRVSTSGVTAFLAIRERSNGTSLAVNAKYLSRGKSRKTAVSARKQKKVSVASRNDGASDSI